MTPQRQKGLRNFSSLTSPDWVSPLQQSGIKNYALSLFCWIVTLSKIGDKFMKCNNRLIIDYFTNVVNILSTSPTDIWNLKNFHVGLFTISNTVFASTEVSPKIWISNPTFGTNWHFPFSIILTSDWTWFKVDDISKILTKLNPTLGQPLTFSF